MGLQPNIFIEFIIFIVYNAHTLPHMAMHIMRVQHMWSSFHISWINHFCLHFTLYPSIARAIKTVTTPKYKYIYQSNLLQCIKYKIWSWSSSRLAFFYLKMHHQMEFNKPSMNLCCPSISYKLWEPYVNNGALH